MDLSIYITNNKKSTIEVVLVQQFSPTGAFKK